MNIYSLPTSLRLGGVDFAIRTDFRVIIGIMQQMQRDDFDDTEKWEICLRCLFIDYDTIPQAEYMNAIQAAKEFLAAGTGGNENDHGRKPPVVDWEQDGPIIIPAVNAVAGKEVRAEKYVHWWTFLGWFTEIEHGTFSTVCAIRTKRNKGEKLEKWEQDFCKEHPELVYLRKKQTDEEKQRSEAEKQALFDLIG